MAHMCHLSLVSGMPGSVGGSAPPAPGAGGGKAAIPIFPPVLKNELPSGHILKYMEGLTKRSMKITEARLKLYCMMLVCVTVLGQYIS